MLFWKIAKTENQPAMHPKAIILKTQSSCEEASNKNGKYTLFKTRKY